MRTWFVLGFKSRAMIFATHLYLAPRLRMLGAVPILLYVLMAYSGTK